MPKLNQSIETEVINEHGEIVSRRANKTLSWGSEPAYIKLYLADIVYLSDLPKQHERLLFELLRRATYSGDANGMSVTLSAGIKRFIAKALGITNIRSISNALGELTKGKILTRVETGVYQFNPYLFGKGDWQDIARLRIEMNYDEIAGRTFKSNCIYKNSEENNKIEEGE
jgi:hypothetical protein